MKSIGEMLKKHWKSIEKVLRNIGRLWKGIGKRLASY